MRGTYSLTIKNKLYSCAVYQKVGGARITDLLLIVYEADEAAFSPNEAKEAMVAEGKITRKQADEALAYIFAVDEKLVIIGLKRIHSKKEKL